MGFLTRRGSKGSNKRKFRTPNRVQTAEPPQKRRKTKAIASGGFNQGNASQMVPTEQGMNGTRCWKVFYAKRSNKKHKDWMDGILHIDAKKATLKDTDTASTVTSMLWTMRDDRNLSNHEDQNIFIKSFEVEIDQTLPVADFESGRCYNTFVNEQQSTKMARSFKPVQPVPTTSTQPRRSSFKMPSRIKNGKRVPMAPSRSKRPSAISRMDRDPSKMRNPLVLNMKNLNSDFTPNPKKGNDQRPVVVEEFLSEKLRSHQREGVQFMYECIMGIRHQNQTGCILADGMGLGKTLQTLVVIYTLLNTGPKAKTPAIRKCLVVCPSSLVGNWKKEFSKWIEYRVAKQCKVTAMNAKKKEKQNQKIRDFQTSRYTVLIIGYEMLRSYEEELSAVGIGLIVCDEGHRLKNVKGNKTIHCLESLQCTKRILLTGTPIQNNLSELYAMSSFAIPDCLGDLNSFQNRYAKPIEAGRSSDCTDAEKRIGDQRSKALYEECSKFILRRTTENIMRQHLPPKDIHIVFHSMSDVQREMYQWILKRCSSLWNGSKYEYTEALAVITLLRMCCTCPRTALVSMSSSKVFGGGSMPSKIMKKLNALMLSLVEQSQSVGDKIVIVSNYTSVLDAAEEALQSKEWQSLRLDGTINAAQRTEIVSDFNSQRNIDKFVFLLSAKAGGVGLNLIAANRIVLLDPDWNPATDQQTMARIWRDGQQKKCTIYRLIATGSIEEKILQRQIQKVEVADSVVDRRGRARHKHKDRHFTKNNVKELFTLKTDLETCETLDILSVDAIKEYQVITKNALIATMIPIIQSQNGDEYGVNVLFTRTVDSKTDPASKWNIKASECSNLDGGDWSDSDHDSEEAEFQISNTVQNSASIEEDDGFQSENEPKLANREKRIQPSTACEEESDDEDDCCSVSRPLRSTRKSIK